MGGILDFENSEALIDLDDKAIGQEGNYTVCSQQPSDEDFEMKRINDNENKIVG